jgi:hypothetical protein
VLRVRTLLHVLYLLFISRLPVRVVLARWHLISLLELLLLLLGLRLPAHLIVVLAQYNLTATAVAHLVVHDVVVVD